MNEGWTTRHVPARLVVVRHGQSLGNLADAAAREGGSGRLELTTRDADTPLSDTGREQAQALGRAVARRGAGERPGLVLTSPYVRAADTATIALSGLADGTPVVARDERLRERDLGAFDGLTCDGIRAAHPEEAERRAFTGKLYYRPPGGESWTDVALRVRQLVADLAHTEHECVWVFTHQAVILAFRLVLEGLTEEEVLRIDREEPLPNTSVTTYERDDAGRLRLSTFADVSHLEQEEAPTTREEPAHEPVDRLVDEGTS
ncbi:histidine phosphatase family protein [Terracoccus luteus]|uniref:phosphoglycerate mutase (2,3-diphosphoglycerate-dependent) n=1 Tax=Terracoccus luteus TaxID=53356 RepID=A0A839PXP0_9MICO|nr:histidine phosphatase family protein [Terracoccus luteus]MBB2986795.1 broad specificity phosphatase PhoE [Terracoccus luteus]MCP2172446.1 broad specificity phosphatase PhoE [Terracoccus luteus]